MAPSSVTGLLPVTVDFHLGTTTWNLNMMAQSVMFPERCRVRLSRNTNVMKITMTSASCVGDNDQP